MNAIESDQHKKKRDIFLIEECAIRINSQYQIARHSLFQLSRECAEAGKNFDKGSLAVLMKLLDLNDAGFDAYSRMGEAHYFRRLKDSLVRNSQKNVGKLPHKPNLAYEETTKSNLLGPSFSAVSRRDVEAKRRLNALIQTMKAHAVSNVPAKEKGRAWPYTDKELRITNAHNWGDIRKIFEKIGCSKELDQIEKTLNESFDTINKVEEERMFAPYAKQAKDNLSFDKGVRVSRSKQSRRKKSV